ncbi:hypothetical protein XM25_00640 [Devosia sp. H5989]|nr:hypothetical protein XM25_00640 [Devosia sp. H5989]
MRHDDVPVADHDVKQVADAVAEKIAPIIVNEANAEPWYQSRVTIGALVSIGTGIAALFGVIVSPQDAELIIGIGVAGGTVIGGLITLYGRWKAKKPLGR